MKKNKTSVLKKVGAIALGLGIVGASVVAGASLFPKEVEVEVPYEVVKYETVVEEVPVEKEVLVDNGNLDLVLDYMLEDDVSLVTEGLEDDEVDLIVDRIMFINEAESIVKNFIKENVFKHRAKEQEVESEDYSDLHVLNIDLKDVDFESYDEFGYTTAKADVSVAFRYNDSGFIEDTYEVEIWNDKVKFI